jgi:hypothetical protein
MPTLEKKTKTELETLVNDQAEQIKQMQQTIMDLQGKVAVMEKRDDVRKNLTGEKMREMAINPQNLHEKLKNSGHSQDVQDQILKNAN